MGVGMGVGWGSGGGVETAKSKSTEISTKPHTLLMQIFAEYMLAFSCKAKDLLIDQAEEFKAVI